MKVFNYVTAVACAVLAGIVFADEDICSTPLSADQLADHWIAGCVQFDISDFAGCNLSSADALSVDSVSNYRCGAD